MSYTTLHQAAELDMDLQARVVAAAVKEAWASPEFAATEFGRRLRVYPQEAIRTFMWPVAVDTEAAYTFAVETSVERPGLDVGVISDAALQAAVQAHWPPDPMPAAPLEPGMVPATPGQPVLAD